MTHPKISVVMPVYNGQAYLRQAIGSVLAQTFEDFELVLINDGSTDGSVAIIESYNDPRIRLLSNAQNSGLPAVRNRGIEEARGDFIAWLDCDDISLPSRLEKQLGVLENNPDIALCGTWVRTMGTTKDEEWHYPIDPEFLRCRMLFDDPIAMSSAMVRKQCLTDHQFRFDPEYPTAEDYDLWERLSRVYKICNYPEVLTLYRIHGNQISATANAEQQKQSVSKLQQRILASLGITPTDQEKTLQQGIGVDLHNFLKAEPEILRVEEWLKKLAQANQKSKVFPEPAFSKVLAERWLVVCRAATKAGLGVCLKFWASPLSKYPALTFARKIRFMVRFFLKQFLKGF